MPAYLIILLFILNIIFGISFFYLVFLLIFHPRKKRKFLGITIPNGIIYLLKDKIVEKITDFFQSYLEINREDFTTSKAHEIAQDITEKAVDVLKSKIIRFLPDFIKNKIIEFVENVIFHFALELSCTFLPEMIERYLIKERVLELFSDENILFIEQKAKYYLTKPVVIFGTGFGFIFATFNLILLIIFSVL